MKVFKAFKDQSLTQNGKRFRLGEQSTTSNPLILRKSGIHACKTIEQCKTSYPGNPVIVECDVVAEDIGDMSGGVLVTRALTPSRIVEGVASTPSPTPDEDDSDEDDFPPSSPFGEADHIAAELETLAERVRNL